MNYQVTVSDILNSFRVKYAPPPPPLQRPHKGLAMGLAAFSSTATAG